MTFYLLLYRLYVLCIGLPVALCVTLACALGVLLVAPFNPVLASRWFGRIWGRVLSRAALSDLAIEGGQHLDEQESYVVVVNHLSLFDIVVLYGWLSLDLKWVMKKELRRVPVIGACCALMGHVFLDRSNSAAAIETLKAVKSELLPGVSMLFFPEGTRSRDGSLKRFKSGAFAMARDLDLPILPVSLLNSDAIIPPDGFDVRPGRVTMHIHAPIDRQVVRASTVGELRDLGRQRIASVMGES